MVQYFRSTAEPASLPVPVAIAATPLTGYVDIFTVVTYAQLNMVSPV